MTEAQQKWIDNIKNQLKSEIEKRWPLSQNDWDKIAITIGEVIEKAGGNIEVRNTLFDFIEPYQKRAEKPMQKEVESDGGRTA